MTQADNLIALAQAIGADIKGLNMKTGSLQDLTTAEKTNLVAALNEVRSQLGSGGVMIDDDNASSTTVYSSARLEQAIEEAINAILDGAPEAFDTLKELADYVESDQTAMAQLTASLNNRVKFNEPQGLNAAEQLQACQNIGIGDPTTDFVASYNTAKA